MKSHWPISILSTLAALFNMLMPLILVRVLHPEEVGAFKIFFLYLILLPAFTFTTGLVNGLAFWAGQEKEKPRAIQISSTLILIFSFLSALATFVSNPWISKLLSWPQSWAILFSLSVFGAIASPFYEEAAIATGRIWSGALFGSGFEIFRALSIVCTAIQTRSLKSVFLAHLIIQTTKIFLGYSLGYRQGLVRLHWKFDIVRKIEKYAFPVSLAWMFGVFVNYSDQVILSTYLTHSQFAVYSMGCLSVPPLIILEYSITRVMIPRLSRAFSENQPRFAAGLYQTAVKELGYFIIPAVIGMTVFAEPIVQLLFTSRYSTAAHYLRFYALSYLFLIFPNDSIPRARGQARWILLSSSTFSLLSLGLCWILVYPFGAWGALAGVLISRLIMRSYCLFYISQSTGWKVSEYLPLMELGKSLSTALLLATLAIFTKDFFRSSLAWFFCDGLAFALLYFMLTFFWKKNTPTQPVLASDRRVLILTQYLGIGGLERMILNLCSGIQERGQWKVSVFVFDHPKQSSPETHLIPKFEDLGIPVEIFSKPRGFSPKTAFQIARYLKAQKFTVIHTHDLGALIYGVLAKWISWNQVRLVHTQHSFVHLQRKKRYRYYDQFFTRFVDHLTVVSEDTKKDYCHLKVPENKINIIENGVFFAQKAARTRAEKVQTRAQWIKNLTLPRATQIKLRQSIGDFWILYMARLHPGKGQDHAFALWKELSPHLRKELLLCFVGPEAARGQINQLRTQIQQAPQSERILYLGPTHHPLSWVQCADIFLSCSEYEGMPLGPIEACGSGVPTLLSRIPGHEILQPFTLQYPLDKPQIGAARLVEVVKKLKSAYSSEATQNWNRSELIRRNFSVNFMAAKYEQLYGGQLE